MLFRSNDLFKGTEIDEQNPLRDGVSVSQLESFCEEFKIAMYAWDKDDSLIEYYKPSKTGGRGVLIFNVFDNHFSPIDDEYEKDSKFAIARNMSKGAKISSNDIESFASKKEPVKKEEPNNIILNNLSRVLEK
mgnify:CR=1 FL=1